MSKIVIGSLNRPGRDTLFYLHWSEDEAGFIGDSPRPKDTLISKLEGEEREIAIVEQAAHDSPGAVTFDGKLVWGTISEARAARVRCTTALKAAKQGRKPEPWEKLALAAGWRPPRTKKR